MICILFGLEPMLIFLGNNKVQIFHIRKIGLTRSKKERTMQQNKSMSDRSEINNLVKKSVLSGIIDNLYNIRSSYISGDEVKGDFLFTGLIETLKEYKNEIGKKDSTF